MFVILENICFIPRSGILDTQEYLRVFLLVEKRRCTFGDLNHSEPIWYLYHNILKCPGLSLKFQVAGLMIQEGEEHSS